MLATPLNHRSNDFEKLSTSFASMTFRLRFATRIEPEETPGRTSRAACPGGSSGAPEGAYEVTVANSVGNEYAADEATQKSGLALESGPWIPTQYKDAQV